MARKVKWSKDALRERNEIIDYWNKRNKSKLYSKKLLLLFREAITTIELFPYAGKNTNRPATKCKVVRDYLIVYAIIENSILIIAIWDSRQDPDKLEKRLK